MKTAIVAIVLLGAGAILYGMQAGVASPRTVLAAVAVESPRAREATRIADHLEVVEAELRARDVTDLSPAQRAARAEHIEVLRAYRERGLFPRNYDFPGERVPYFVDSHGTLCAVAHLISVSGRDDLVERIASTRNNALVADLADDAELIAWLGEAGLSEEEAGRIQPTYGCCWIDPWPTTSASEGYAVASTLVSAVGGVSIGMNLLSLDPDDRRRWPGVFGITAGVAGMSLGFSRLGDDDAPPALTTANIGVGALATAFGTWNLFRISGERADVPVRAASGAVVSAAPVVGAEPGVVVQVRF